MPYDPSLYDDHKSDPDYTPPSFSTWDTATHGPGPRPNWVIAELSALDEELGVLKTGKEADVHLVRRAVPDGPECLLAAKRYRTAEHRMFHRDAGYQEGRRTRRTRDTRALARGTGYGRELAASKWAQAEFEALAKLWTAGAPVPYPVQLSGCELMLEFIGEADGTAAPRLAQYRPQQSRPDADELAELFSQCIAAMRLLARQGFTHGDLSAYNMLVHRGRLVLIDVPQIVDLVMNPQGADYLRRDVVNVCRWFASHGLVTVEYDELFGDLMAEAVSRW